MKNAKAGARAERRTLKPLTRSWMLHVPPPTGGLIHDAPCGCQFVHDEGDRYWERCGAHR